MPDAAMTRELKTGRELLEAALLTGSADAAACLKSTFPIQMLISWKNQAFSALTDRYTRGEAPFCQLCAASQAARALADPSAPPLGCVGAVHGNESGAGRDYMMMLLTAWGVPTLDLGLDQSTEAFLTAVKEHDLRFVVCAVFSDRDFESVIALHRAAVLAGLRDRFLLCVSGLEHGRSSVIPLPADCSEHRAAPLAKWIAEAVLSEHVIPCSRAQRAAEAGTAARAPHHGERKAVPCSRSEVVVFGPEYFPPRPDQEEILSWLRCGDASPCREAYLAAWGSAVALLSSEAKPQAVWLRSSGDRLLLLITLGHSVQDRISTLFRNGDYITGDLLNMLCDQMLFQMDEAAGQLLADRLKDEGLFILDRQEPGCGLGEEEQRLFFASVSDACPQARLTFHGAITPAKSMMYAVTLSRKACRAVLHDCSRCPQTDCLYRKADKKD